jgi:hypothetical protein
MNQTTSSILRERIAKLNKKEFTAEDILYFDPYILDHDAFVKSAISSLCKFAGGRNSEVEIIRKEKCPRGGFQNVYKERNLKVVAPKFKKELHGAIIGKDVSIWHTVWPELFTLPKFANKRVGKSNHCMG